MLVAPGYDSTVSFDSEKDRWGRDRLPLFGCDLAHHHMTLGGALTLRVEIETLARASEWPTREPVTLLVAGEESLPTSARLLIRRMILSSDQCIDMVPVERLPDEVSWPPVGSGDAGMFAYHACDRVSELFVRDGLRPRLQWSATSRAAARRVRDHFGDRLYCVHLRNTGGGAEQSDADFSQWRAFFAAHARPARTEFLLLGDDPLCAEWSPVPGVHRAVDLGIDLVTQLALVPVTDGYLGMASGLGCAANFSELPHVLFKHPRHHADAMERELGGGDRYAYFNSRQALWRRPATREAIDDAFNLIT